MEQFPLLQTDLQQVVRAAKERFALEQHGTHGVAHWQRVRTVQGNLDSLQAMARSSTNAQAHFFPVAGANHFSILAPTTRLIAEKVLRDEGPACQLTFTPEEVGKPFGK